MQLFDLLIIKLQVPVDCTRLWWRTECCGVHFPLRTAHSTCRLITGRSHLYWRRVLHCHPFLHNRTAAAAAVTIPISLLWPAVPRLIRVSAAAPFSHFHHRKPATSHPTLTRRESTTRASKMNTWNFLNVSFIQLSACNLLFAHLL